MSLHTKCYMCIGVFKCECLYGSNNADTNLILDMEDMVQGIIGGRESCSGAGSLESRGVGIEEENWGEEHGGGSLESEEMREEGGGEGQGGLGGGSRGVGNEDGRGEGGRCNEEEAQGGGVDDSMHPEREVVVATGASEYLEERALDERAITQFVSNSCGCSSTIVTVCAGNIPVPTRNREEEVRADKSSLD